MKQIQKLKGKFLFALAFATLAGCSTVSRIDSPNPGTSMELRGYGQLSLPAEVRLRSKATGQHLYRATSQDGKSLYGVLPLHVNGGTMAGSILFFAPALFIGGFRDAFPFYQVDPEHGQLRFKIKEGDEWRSHTPSMAESERARAYFNSVDRQAMAGERTDKAAAPKAD